MHFFIDSLCRDTKVMGPINAVNYPHNKVPLVSLHKQSIKAIIVIRIWLLYMIKVLITWTIDIRGGWSCYWIIIKRTFLMTSVRIALLVRKLWSADLAGWTGLKRPCIAWLAQHHACNNVTNLLCTDMYFLRLHPQKYILLGCTNTDKPWYNYYMHMYIMTIKVSIATAIANFFLPILNSLVDE